jgi:hypothetical protein
MYTTISPLEMTEDPTFEERDGLPNVGATQMATSLTKCDGKAGAILPDGREVGLARVENPSSPSGSMFQWPKFTTEMPWAERVEELTANGPVVLVDNHDRIDRLLKEWNDSIGWIPEGLDAGRGGAGGGLGAGGAFGTGGAEATGAGGAPDAGTGLSPTSGAGCACTLPGRASDTGLASGWLVAVGLALRRLRSRRQA